MLRDEYVKHQDGITRTSRKENRKRLGYFKEIQFTSKEWMTIHELNQELEVSFFKNIIIIVLFKLLIFLSAFQELVGKISSTS